MKKMKTKKIISLFLFFYLSISGNAFASSGNLPDIEPIDQEIIKQKQKNILEESQKKQILGLDLKLQRLKEITTSNTYLPCRNINNVTIENATHLSKSQKEHLIKTNTSQCMTTEDINSLVHTISNYYMEQGYITSRAFLKHEDIQKGNLFINVVEGKIDQIKFNGEDLLALKMVFPNMKEKILNLRDIEQGLDQLNRLSSYQIKIDIKPSNKIGYSDIILKNNSSKSLPANINFGFDNNGSKNTGVNQFNSTLELDNILRLADSWIISINKNTDFSNNHKNWYITSGLSIPYGYWLFSYQYSKNESFQNTFIGNREFRYTGKGQSHNLKVNRTLYRDGKHKIGLNVGLTQRKTENIIGDLKLIISSPTLSTLNIGFNYNSALFGGYLSFNPAYTHGLDFFGATKDNNFEDTQKSKFYKLSTSASYFKLITDDIYYLTSIYGQYSPKNLYSSERISLGGQYSIRGFKDQNITGNLGGYWRNDINCKLIRIPKIGELSLKNSLDTGWIKNEDKRGSDGGNLTGASLGLTLDSNKSTHSITIGKPLKYPTYLKPDNWVIYWSTSLNF
jgi:hemolysin activation/secretion protein